jgi:hypothetical protein
MLERIEVTTNVVVGSTGGVGAASASAAAPAA